MAVSGRSAFASAMFDLEMRYLPRAEGWRRDYGLGARELRGVSHYEVFPEIPERWKELHRRAPGRRISAKRRATVLSGPTAACNGCAGRFAPGTNLT